MRVLGIVPARAGSKRLVGKNLRLLGGKPLVDWAIAAARGAARLTRVVVSSDDEDVIALAGVIDPALPLRRPIELATDTALAVDYVSHALATLEDGGEDPFDVVVIVQPTSPFTTSEDIDATVGLLTEGVASAVSVMKLDHAIHPLKLKTLADDGTLLPYLEEERDRMADHELPPLYVRNGSVYVTRRPVIESGSIIGAPCVGYVMPRERSVDINDAIDLAFAEFLLSRRAV